MARTQELLRLHGLSMALNFRLPLTLFYLFVSMRFDKQQMVFQVQEALPFAWRHWNTGNKPLRENFLEIFTQRKKALTKQERHLIKTCLRRPTTAPSFSPQPTKPRLKYSKTTHNCSKAVSCRCALSPFEGSLPHALRRAKKPDCSRIVANAVCLPECLWRVDGKRQACSPDGCFP